jgi:hypothetical protein
MFENPWFWAFSSIASALLGAATLAYVRDTKIGIKGYQLFDFLIDKLRDKYNIHALDQPVDAWRNQQPELAAKIDQLENRLEKLEELEKLKN